MTREPTVPEGVYIRAGLYSLAELRKIMHPLVHEHPLDYMLDGLDDATKVFILMERLGDERHKSAGLESELAELLDDLSQPMTRERISGVYCPTNAEEWARLLDGTGIDPPDQAFWSFEPAANAVESYSTAVVGWTRRAFGHRDRHVIDDSSAAMVPVREHRAEAARMRASRRR